MLNEKVPGTIKMIIAYDGTDYAGWQRQAEDSPDPRPTLQATLESALSKLFNRTIKVQASGRTDAGVHAEAQVVHFNMPLGENGQPVKTTEELKNLVHSLNAMTPKSLAITKAFTAPSDFNALHSAVRKTYRYQIHNSPIPHPHRRLYSAWVKKPLDINKLNGLCEMLIGTHDFKSFQTSGTPIKNTVRTIEQARWSFATSAAPDWLHFHITGTGFLKQMVRNIVGTALYLHNTNGTPADMLAILQACDRQKAKQCAQPEGLFLESVEYPTDLDNQCREL